MLPCKAPFSLVVHYLSQLSPDCEQIVLHGQQSIRVSGRKREKDKQTDRQTEKERERERERLVSQPVAIHAAINCSTKWRCMINGFLNSSHFTEDYSYFEWLFLILVKCGNRMQLEAEATNFLASVWCFYVHRCLTRQSQLPRGLEQFPLR